MKGCLTPEAKAFLVDLIDLTEIVGPRDMEQVCQSRVEEGQECRLDDTIFKQRLGELAIEVANIPLCGEEDSDVAP